MVKSKNSDVKVGDLVEIRTRRGLFYAQVTHKHKTYGPLLRVFENSHENRPNDVNELVDQNDKFVAFVGSFAW